MAVTHAPARSPLPQVALAAALITLGEVFIFWRNPPVTDYYFILVWSGYILAVDAWVYVRTGGSELHDHPSRLAAMFPLSMGFWWVFEGYNVFVQNWVYLGGAEYVGLKYIVVSSLFYSTVLPAVWETAQLLLSFMAPGAKEMGGPSQQGPPLPDAWKRAAMVLSLLGLALALLPLLATRYAFPLVWVGLFVALDPLNARAGRPSILSMLRARRWRVPLAFYIAPTVTGFFWEFWNYWAWPKWVYNVPIPDVPRLFEMPLPGYLGYGPFGWELFAMYWFVVGMCALGDSLRLRRSYEGSGAHSFPDP